ncbi:hypothetical protein B0H13DRAFT_1850136 [Mycena leptocephala]|nr:hypothetical protein B0H13DRAFT_1850136 [Mycena leptocephala]
MAFPAPHEGVWLFRWPPAPRLLSLANKQAHKVFEPSHHQKQINLPRPGESCRPDAGWQSDHNASSGLAMGLQWFWIFGNASPILVSNWNPSVGLHSVARQYKFNGLDSIFREHEFTVVTEVKTELPRCAPPVWMLMHNLTTVELQGSRQRHSANSLLDPNPRQNRVHELENERGEAATASQPQTAMMQTGTPGRRRVGQALTLLDNGALILLTTPWRSGKSNQVRDCRLREFCAAIRSRFPWSSDDDISASVFVHR